MQVTNTTSIQEIARRQIETTKQVYLLSPARMFSEYNGEKENVKNYNGRQLLEMIQNADDAASEAKDKKKALIRLHKKQLIIANTGYPFSEEGLTSIFHSHLSPKEAQENQIGKKGLGFRSILSWAKKVTIKSHDLCVSFSKKYSEGVLKELLQNAEFSRSYKKLRKAKTDVPISILVCPELQPNHSDFFKDFEEFDTTILIDLKDDVLEQVHQQIIKDLDGEILLFLNNLESIEVDINGDIVTHQKILLRENRVKLISCKKLMPDGTSDNEWNINSLTGSFPDLNRSYQLVIAWKDGLDETKDVIYSYFRTKVPFKLKGILHGTFELNADRNDILIEDIYNKNLITLIPQLIANTAEIIATNNRKYSDYKALSFCVFENDSLPSIMKEYDFSTKLTSALSHKEIFPTISNKYISIEDKPVFYSDETLTTLLPPEEFPDILKLSNDEGLKQRLTVFANNHYTFKSLCDTLTTRIHKYSIPEYALLIKSIIQYADIEQDPNDKSLFFDIDFNPLTFGQSIFLPPGDGVEKLPVEVGVQVIHPELTEHLKGLFNASSYESLAEQLSAYKIKTFNFIEIVEIIIAHFRLDKLKGTDVKILNRYLFSLFTKEKPQTTLWQGSAVPLISKTKNLRNAAELYFGKEYDNNIVDSLYSYDKNKLLAPPKEFNVEESEVASWKVYLKWLGVSEYPRPIQVRESSDFADFAFKKFDYRNRIEDYHFTSYEKFKLSKNRFGQISVQSIDDIDEILSKNKPETVIAWLCSDDAIYKLIEKDCEPDKSFIEVHFGSDWYNRKISGARIRNFLKWKLSRYRWLNTKSQIKQAPILCTTSATISPDFSPLIEKPDIKYDDLTLKSNQIHNDKVDYLLNIIGVNKTISTFETSILYSILNKLPQIDPEGKKAKTLYRELATNYDEKNLDIDDAEYKSFCSSGKVFCRRFGVYSYENNNVAFYVDNKRYGESIINQFHTIDVERRRSQDKIKKIFHVEPLKGLRLTLANVPTYHTLNNGFEREIEMFKPYVYVFRQDLDSSGREKNLIKDAKFKLVTDLHVLLEKESEKSEFQLSPYEYIYLAREKTIYLKTPEYIQNEKTLKEDVAFCSTIAEAFSALIDVDAQRQQIRELFSKSTSGRDDIIRSELDDSNLEKLMIAKSTLGIVNDPKINFWTAFVKCFPSKRMLKDGLNDEEFNVELARLFPEFRNLIAEAVDKINYDDYSEESCLRTIVDLLHNCRISLNKFNQHIYPSLDISELYSLDFMRTKELYKKDFKKLLYMRLIGEQNSRKDFLKMLSQYDSLKGMFRGEINYDIGSDLKDQLSELFQMELTQANDINFEQLYSENKAKYESKALEMNVSKELSAQFINQNLERESLLYFEDEIDNIIELLKKWMSQSNISTSNGQPVLFKKQITIGGKAFFYNDLSELYQTLEKQDALQTSLSRIKIKNLDPNKLAKKERQKRTIKSPKKIRQLDEDFGFLGEWIVYKHLLTSIKNSASVKWVSENAKLAGINSDGRDGLGYDIEYVPNDGKYPRYAEVKVVGWENAFHITSNEILQGEKLKKYYEIFLVRNIMDGENIQIELIQGPFDYKSQKSFNDNDLFSVVNDSFILKFQKIDE